MSVIKASKQAVSSVRGEGLLCHDDSLLEKKPLTALQSLILGLGSAYRVLIFDPNDATMSTIVSGKFSAVLDQSTNAYNGSQTTAGKRFLNTGAINTRACARSTKSSATWMDIPAISLGNNRTIAVLYRCVTAPGALDLYPLVVLNNGSDTDLTKLALNGSVISTHPRTMRTHASTSGVGLACDTALDTSPHLDIYTHTGTDPDTGYSLYVDGVAATLVSSGSLGLTPSVAPSSAIGVDYLGINGLSDVDFGMVILGSAVMGAPERAALKAYCNAPVASGGWGMSVA